MYAKLFSRIAQSSLMEEDVTTRYTFIMMLAMADSQGDVIGTDVAIARMMNITKSEFCGAIEQLMRPDPDSNSPVHEGRRIIPSDSGRGYRIVNYLNYRAIKSDDEKREYMREYMRKRRDAEKALSPVNDVKLCKAPSSDVTHTEAEAEAEAEAERSRSRARSIKSAAERAAKPDLSEIMPTGAAADMLALQGRIQAIKPAWKLALTYEEQQAMLRNGACLASLEDADWDRLKRYLEAKLPEGTPGWQPRSRGKFIETLPDVHDHACRWEEKNGNKPKMKGWG